MNTPSHIIINLFILGNQKSANNSLPIIIGSILPDIAIFWFYFWTKLVKNIPESRIWSETYYSPFWQNIFAIPNSIILCLIGVGVAHYWQQPFWKILFLSMIVHCLFDLPVHHDDAHRHFVPLSNYRFISPVSYWDKNHYGRWIALLELLLVLGSSYFLYVNFQSWWVRFLLLSNSSLSLIFYLKFYL